MFFSPANWAKPSHRYVRRLLDGLARVDKRSRSDLRLIVVASQCTAEQLAAFLPSPPGDVAIVHDPARELMTLFGVTRVPTVVEIDRAGHLAEPEMGYAPERVDALLARLRSP